MFCITWFCIKSFSKRCLFFSSLGRTLAEKVACTPERVDPLQWLHALKHLESALELCRESAKKELDIEAELLFQIGKYNPVCSS